MESRGVDVLEVSVEAVALRGLVGLYLGIFLASCAGINEYLDLVLFATSMGEEGL